jgi:hypothetical protein
MTAEFVYLALGPADTKGPGRFNIPVTCYTDIDGLPISARFKHAWQPTW